MSNLSWQPLRSLRAQFDLNLGALDTHDPALASALRPLEPTHEILIATEGDCVHLARNIGGAPVVLSNPVTAEGAARITAKLCPTGKCTEPLLIAGLDQGWLWKALFDLPIHAPSFPGYTPPLYFLTNDLERLWCALHLHDWRELLTDPRVRLFAGADCFARAQAHMAANLHLPFPQLSVTVDESTWAGASLDSMRMHALTVAGAKLQKFNAELAKSYAHLGATELADKFSSGEPLRVMGITSRFTTFLQYSMRDWLSACESLGHETKLLIEEEDCALFNSITFAEACAAFKPDLLLMIDRYRGEFSGMPQNVPWIMWVQDQLPHIFCDAAGQAQKQFDYTIGYGRIDCVHTHKYPSDRFLPAMIGTNEQRFVPRRLTHEERNRFTCDVSFVSHCSMPADVLLKQEIERLNNPAATRVLEGIFERLRGEYDAGRSVTRPHQLPAMIATALQAMNLTTQDQAPLLNIFSHKINNALFRHQTLEWLSETDARIKLFGRGWENHPKFSRYACGIADNEQALSAIYQASRINLQVTPFGAAHQRVFDGLAAGGFFLMRFCDGDAADVLYRDLAAWCRENDIRDDDQLRDALTSAPPNVRGWMDSLQQIDGCGVFDHGCDFMTELLLVADDGFTRSASTLWDEYDRVVFRSREELHSLVAHFLTDDADRAQIARAMRQRVLEKMTYRSITQRAIDFVRDDLVRQASAVRVPQPLAA